jgi:uncharacterized protein involved in exopolysaccharide biosynthesis
MADQGADRFGFDATDPPFRRLAVVLVCGLLGVLVALGALALAPPRYQASAELALPSLAAAAAAEDAATSPAVLRQAAATLAPQPRPDRQGLAELRAMVGRALRLEEPAPPDAATIRSRVTARRSGERVVITVTDDDGQDAARLADAVARAVLAQMPEQAPSQVTSQTPSQLANQLPDRLPPQAPQPPAPPPASTAPSPNAPDEDARARLDRLRAEAEVRSAAVRQADEALLVKLRTRLAAATVRTAEQRVRLSQIERLMRSGNYRDAVPEVAQSPEITALREQVVEVKRQERRAARVLGTRHPSLKALRDERRRIERQIAAELQRILASVRQELERAETAEQALSREIETQRSELAAAVEALTRLRELERTLASSASQPAAPQPARTEPARTEAAAPAPAPVLAPASTPAPILAPSPPAGRLIATAVPPSRPEGLPPAALIGIGLAAGCSLGTAVAAVHRRPRR